MHILMYVYIYIYTHVYIYIYVYAVHAEIGSEALVQPFLVRHLDDDLGHLIEVALESPPIVDGPSAVVGRLVIAVGDVVIVHLALVVAALRDELRDYHLTATASRGLGGGPWIVRPCPVLHNVDVHVGSHIPTCGVGPVGLGHALGAPRESAAEAYEVELRDVLCRLQNVIPRHRLRRDGVVELDEHGHQTFCLLRVASCASSMIHAS